MASGIAVAIQRSSGRRLHGACRRCGKRSPQQQHKEHIYREISKDGNWELVDATFHVLICSGMSTPSLREAAEHGIDVEHAGKCELCVAVTVPFVWSWLASMSASCAKQPFLSCLLPLQVVLVCVSWVAISPDRRGFACKTWVILFVLPVFVAMCVLYRVMPAWTGITLVS